MAVDKNKNDAAFDVAAIQGKVAALKFAFTLHVATQSGREEMVKILREISVGSSGQVIAQLMQSELNAPSSVVTAETMREELNELAELIESAIEMVRRSS